MDARMQRGAVIYEKRCGTSCKLTMHLCVFVSLPLIHYLYVNRSVSRLVVEIYYNNLLPSPQL